MYSTGWLRRFFLAAALAVGLLQRADALKVVIQADRDTVPMGHSVAVDVAVTTDAGRPAEGCRVLSYVNERRWGAHEVTDAAGRARLTLPLPNPGPAHIQVQAVPALGRVFWIWTPQTSDEQTAFFRKTFTLAEPPRRAALRIAVDDRCTVKLNGRLIGEAKGWSEAYFFEHLETSLRPGENVLEAEAHNATGPAGLLAELRIETGQGEQTIATDETWEARGAVEGPATPAKTIAKIEAPSIWSPKMPHWPGLGTNAPLMAGTPIPEEAQLSKIISVQVTRRVLEVYEDPEHLIGIQWEPWFTPLNAYWQTAQAVPIIGFYTSYHADVMRQHALWLMDAGVNFIYVDWSNHIWGAQHWNDRPPGANEIIHATTLTLEAYAVMREEGLPVPKAVIMPGLSNGPPATMQALNEELDWIYQNYLRNPRFDGLWVVYEGKPLIVPLDTAAVALRPETPPIDAAHFTVRWMGTQLQITKLEKHGYWSWMDGSLEPIVTYREGVAEVVTPTPAYFAEGGWTYPSARGRRGGTTFIESFKAAMKHRPRFVLLHQWNEYAGQPEGQGHGPNRDHYVDSYSVELSDDLEPVSLTADGYRGDTGGWGFHYYNLMRALIRLYHQKEPEDTVLAAHVPTKNGEVTDNRVTVEWSVIGKPATGFTVSLDGRVLATGLNGNTYNLNLSDTPDGPHMVTVTAEGGTTRFPLSHTQMDEILASPVPTAVGVTFHRKRPR